MARLKPGLHGFCVVLLHVFAFRLRRLKIESMPVTIYRHHHEDECEVHKMKKLPAEKVRIYPECECPIWMYGQTDKQKYPRQSTKLRDWKTAQKMIKALNAGDKDETIYGLTLAKCIEKYLACRKRDLNGRTYAQYVDILARLEEYANRNNKYYMNEITVDLVSTFQNFELRHLESTTLGTYMAKIKQFFKEANVQDWGLTKSISDKIKTPTGVYDPSFPYSEAEVTAILEEAGKLSTPSPIPVRRRFGVLVPSGESIPRGALNNEECSHTIGFNRAAFGGILIRPFRWEVIRCGPTSS
jgi:hypothetical protein